MKIKREYLDYLYLGFFILVLISFFTGILVSAIGYSMVVIDNPDPNSMWPTYFQGDLFILHDTNPRDIGIGDVVVYEKSSGDKIIHRVIDIIIVNDHYYFRVKGDNLFSNSTPDQEGTTLISESRILGKVEFRIPYLGHLSLAMQRNAAIQIFVYFIALMLGIAIVFWPEHEEEEAKKEEMVEVSPTAIKNTILGFFMLPVTVIKDIKSSKHRKLYIFGPILLIILLIVPVFATSLLPVSSTPKGLGVMRIEHSRTQNYTDNLQSQNFSYTFVQVEVTLYDNDGLWKRIKGFTLNAYTEPDNPNSIISKTKWNTFRDFKGIITVGASLVIHPGKLPDFTQTVYLEVILHWVEFFVENSRTYEAEITL